MTTFAQKYQHLFELRARASRPVCAPQPATVPDGLIVCRHCGQTLPAEAFPPSMRNTKRGRCSACQAVADRRKRANRLAGERKGKS